MDAPLKEVFTVLGILPLTGQVNARWEVPVGAGPELDNIVCTLNDIGVSTDALVRATCQRLHVKGETLDSFGNIIQKYNENGNPI